jgi:FAD:protein FMN transferase
MPLLKALLLSSAALLCACAERPLHLAGATQGTTYHITLVPQAAAPDAAPLQQAVAQRLAEIDRALSGYRDDSELSRFNRAPVGEWIDIGADLYAVLKFAERISELSGGAFDITAAPLIRLWGFGAGTTTGQVPDADAIAQARAQVGFRQLEIDPQRPRARKLKALTIDVDGIAQGYTVDQLADLLARSGWDNYLVEVGGELRLAGHNPQGRPWRIGIETPARGFANVRPAIEGSGIAITSAGDYRDYFERDGVRYSHTIDPTSGRPAAHQLASVTVIATSATMADGLDTALEVLGPERGAALAESLGVAAYFIVRKQEGFSVHYTEAMAPYLRR